MKLINCILLISCLALVFSSKGSISKPTYRFSWPTYTAKVTYVSDTIKVGSGQTYDGLGKPYAATSQLGNGNQNENQQPIFEVEDGGVVQNVIIDIDGADGIHCLGSCTLKNVWWLTVGEDCATLKASNNKNPLMLIVGGGVRDAKDKVFQHNGPGTIKIMGGFQVENFGKLYRSCGNCKTQYHRNVIIDGVKASNPDKGIVGINAKYSGTISGVDEKGDKATIKDLTVYGGSPNMVCEKYIGNNKGKEPGDPFANGPDSQNCLYSTSDVTFY